MSDHKREAAASQQAKMGRMGLNKDQKDASFTDTKPYDGVPYIDSGLAGSKPVGKQRFKRGGKVAHAEGMKAKKNLGHRPRKQMGGGNLGDLNMGAPAGEDVKKRLPPDLANIKNPNMQASPKPVTMTPPPRPPEFTSRPSDKTFTPEEAEEFMRPKKAGGGMAGPNAKKIVAALAMRKKRAGLPYAPPGRMGAMSATPAAPMLRKKGGKVSEMEWEHSKEDLREDKKLAKKHHMSMSDWEKSDLDKKHDRQQSTKGLKHGGGTKREQEKYCWGGEAKRVKRASGGGTKAKGATRINIMLGAPQDTMAPAFRGGGGGSPIQQPMAPKPPVPTPPAPPMPPPMMPPMGGGMPGLPGGMPPLGGGAPMGGMPGAARPPMPMMRKSGGRTIHQETQYGSGSGLGRLEKTKWPFFGESKKGGK